MSKLSKAIKLAQGLTDEERVEFADFFKVEEQEEKQEVKKEVKEEIKKEVKQEEKQEEQSELKKLFTAMNEKIESLETKLIKQTPFGKKQKQGSGKESTEFDDLFSELRSKQRG
ncbi:MAG: hypothetical protein GQ557_02255 [Mycoplasmataceae bacterium]|nr:hypothetical protein [Mycoplasmataceae bacterium]